MTAAFFNFSPQEMMFYLSRRVREVETQEKNIHGLVLNKTRRTFHVTFPISGLNIVKTVALQGAELFPADPASEDERKITELKSRDSIWSEKGRLKFEVEATYFDEAAQEARRKATFFLDWLSYSLKLCQTTASLSCEFSIHFPIYMESRRGILETVDRVRIPRVPNHELLGSEELLGTRGSNFHFNTRVPLLRAVTRDPRLHYVTRQNSVARSRSIVHRMAKFQLSFNKALPKSGNQTMLA